MSARRLVLIRHAKAKQGDRDIERPLARTGRADAVVIGEWLARYAVPDRAIVSPAVRTRQTWSGAVEALPIDPEQVVDDRIYDNTVRSVVEAIRGCDDSVETLAVVGHNPSMQAMAARADRDTDAGMEALLSFPTATVALLEWVGEWSAYDAERALLIAVQTCRADRG